MRLASFQIGEPFEASEILRMFPNIEDLGSGKWWIKDFCTFQYGQLSPDCRPHQNVSNVLKNHGLLERVSKGYTKSIERDKDKDKDKEKEKEQDRPKEKEAIRIAAIFKRRPTTSWSPNEIKVYKSLYPVDPEELDLLEKYYGAESSNPKNCLRRDMSTFLNNFRGEVDRARNYRIKKRDVTI